MFWVPLSSCPAVIANVGYKTLSRSGCDSCDTTLGLFRTDYACLGPVYDTIGTGPVLTCALRIQLYKPRDVHCALNTPR
jgi:hypothetical protein